ncbi:MAG: tetratricopeptide repeat protein [Rubripirellula sp.]|nr:tetratricopeptide repeat protein [Rubripirellula sp.]
MRSRSWAASAAIITAVAAGGCSTTGSTWNALNPFSSNQSNEIIQAAGEPETRIASTVDSADTVERAGGFSASAKRAWNSTTSAVTGLFSRDQDEVDEEQLDPNDPLSLSHRPDRINAEVFIANGQLWESTGDFKQAMDSYTRALAAEPGHGPALASIARLHFRQSSYGEAAKYFRLAAESQPDEAGLQNDLGLTLSKQGETAAAIEHLTKALALSPGNSRYANNLASVLFGYGDSEAALQTLVENNQPAVAHFNMAYLCFQSGQLSQARDHFSEVMKYQAISNDDEATRKAVERTREMLAGLDQTYQRQPSERIASNTSDVMVNEDVGTRTLDIDSRTNVAVPFALPTGYRMDSEQP